MSLADLELLLYELKKELDIKIHHLNLTASLNVNKNKKEEGGVKT